jgi:hypothetical protein
MLQVPVPPVPPVPPLPDFDPNLMLSGDDIAKIVLFAMLGLVFVAYAIARGPIGAAIGAAIRRMAGEEPRPATLPGELEALRAELDHLRAQVGELAERQDFAERMLAQARKDRQLPGAADVAG